MLDRLSGGTPRNSNAIRLPRAMPTLRSPMRVTVPKRSTACALTVTTTTRLNTPPSVRGFYLTRCRAMYRHLPFHAPNRQGCPSGLKHQEGLVFPSSPQGVSRTDIRVQAIPIRLHCGNRMRHSVRGGRVRSAHGDVRRLTPGIVAWAAELTPGTPLR